MKNSRSRRTVSYIPYSFVPNHTRTIEALARSNLSGRQFRTVLFIMRQTDGYLRNEDSISPAFFARNTGISKDHVPHVLSSLKKLNIITALPGSPHTYSVNPPEFWRQGAFAKSGEKSPPNPARNLAKNGENQLRPKDNLKTTTKEYGHTKNRDRYSQDPDKYLRGKYGHFVKH